eukprot:m.415383 g.415383  ORF g.415383 m.415383 type:complete len:78 (+) comp56597_c0_seq30:1481-1714(+)
MNEGRLKYALQQIHWAHLQIPLANIHANQPDLERSGSFTSVTTWLSLTERLTCEFSLTRPNSWASASLLMMRLSTAC